MITQSDLKDILRYDSATGAFFWLVTRGKARVGSEAGKLRRASDRYVSKVICIRGRSYKAHRLAWLYVYGCWPDGEIDHINNDPLDNKIANLRVATHAQNLRNQRLSMANTSGVKGVTWNAATSSWKAQIKVSGKCLHLGLFRSLDDAAFVRKQAEQKEFGEFARG